MPMRPYVVQKGDYLTRLASERGFDADAVWNDSKNDALREKRSSKDMLAQGDVVYLPARPHRAKELPAGGSHRYTASVPRVKFKVKVTDGADAVANEACVVKGAGKEPIETQTDGDGFVEIEVSARVRVVTLHVPGKKSFYELHVGCLEPHTAPAGARQRLEHLGYYGPDPALFGIDAAPDDGDPAALDEGAIRAFQRHESLTVSGELDDATLAKLLEKHGS